MLARLCSVEFAADGNVRSRLRVWLPVIRSARVAVRVSLVSLMAVPLSGCGGTSDVEAMIVRFLAGRFGRRSVLWCAVQIESHVPGEDHLM